MQLGLGLRVLNPLNWPRLSSPYFDRIDLAAEYYDTLLFKHHTYDDLITRGMRPFVVLNATDMSMGSRFEFTQEQFDLLYSDMGSYPLARAVAASSAFPVLLSPLTLKNYPDRPGFAVPGWITSGLKDAENNPGRFKIAKAASSYTNAAERRYIHLLDGGISDNIGLRGPSQSLLSTDGQDTILRKIDQRKIKKIAIITVNAKPGGGLAWDKKKRAPGLLGVLSTVTSAPMDNYSFETIQSLSEKIDSDYVKPKQTERDFRQFLKQNCPNVSWPADLPDLSFYNIELSFDHIKDRKIRERLKALGTNYHLTADEVELLKQAARELLWDSAQYRELVDALKEIGGSEVAIGGNKVIGGEGEAGGQRNVRRAERKVRRQCEDLWRHGCQTYRGSNTSMNTSMGPLLFGRALLLLAVTLADVGRAVAAEAVDPPQKGRWPATCSCRTRRCPRRTTPGSRCTWPRGRC